MPFGRLLYRQPGGPPRVRRRSNPGICRSSTGGIRTHTRQGLSLVALPISLPCLTSTQSPRRESNPHVRHTKTASCHYITRASTTYQLDIIKSAQRDSNPHIRHGKAVRSHYIMGATIDSTSGGIRTRETTLEEWRVAATPQTHQAHRTSGSGGNRTHIYLFKRQAPGQFRTHFRYALAGSGLHGSRTRTLPLDKRPLYRLSF